MNQPGAASLRDLRITAYNTDLGFLTEHRRLPLTKGLSMVEITDIPALIDPTSVHFVPQQGVICVVEQSFQYDLAGPDRILQRYLGHPIEAILKEGVLKRGDLLSYDKDTLVLRSEGGAIGLILRSEVVDARLPNLPEGLRTRPTLVWLLESSIDGDVDVELSYLTGGIAWRAEYVAVTNESDSEVELAAWISLENQSGASFADAQLQLMAGDVHSLPSPRAVASMERESPMLMMRPGTLVREERLFEYHLYTLDRRVTIADREAKQIALFPSATTPVKKSYLYEGGRHSRKIRVLLEMENREDVGLGMPLPEGKIRTYKKDSGNHLHFIGEDWVDHTPRNEKLRLGVGSAFDVVGERKVISEKRVSQQVGLEEVEVRIRNRKLEPIEVTVRESLWPYWAIVKSTHEHTKHDGNVIDFKLQVPADKEEVLTFSYRHGA